MSKTPFLSPEDLSAIEAAVREAETRTTGEIYCVVSEESSDYGETPLAWAAGVALLGPLRFTDQAALVPRVDGSLLGLSFLILVVTATLAGFPAANRASRLDPVQALRDD